MAFIIKYLQGWAIKLNSFSLCSRKLLGKFEMINLFNTSVKFESNDRYLQNNLQKFMLSINSSKKDKSFSLRYFIPLTLTFGENFKIFTFTSETTPIVKHTEIWQFNRNDFSLFYEVDSDWILFPYLIHYQPLLPLRHGHPPPIKSLKVLRSPHLVHGLGATASYIQALQFIKQNLLPDFRPTVIVTDFESALREMLTRHFPTATAHGCWFHINQAVW
ncbi:MULE domain-containing protein [Aphis craccivora]|uniref:MULE domain-containing protein n=1 Tax=Aphis craccivora TaxID=307492 RepID=A0A6G0YWK0_APHCR|nr:MULE domain-containing protein [Aphis craccivora]